MNSSYSFFFMLIDTYYIQLSLWNTNLNYNLIHNLMNDNESFKHLALELMSYDLLSDELKKYYNVLRIFITDTYGEKRFLSAEKPIIFGLINLENNRPVEMGATVLMAFANLQPSNSEFIRLIKIIHDIIEADDVFEGAAEHLSLETLDFTEIRYMLTCMIYPFINKDPAARKLNLKIFHAHFMHTTKQLLEWRLEAGLGMPEHLTAAMKAYEDRDAADNLLASIEKNGVDESEIEESVADEEYSEEIREMLRKVAKELGVEYIEVVMACNSVSDKYPEFCKTIHSLETCVRCQVVLPGNERLIDSIASIGGFDGDNALELVPAFDTRMLEMFEKHGSSIEVEAYSQKHAHLRMSAWKTLMERVYNMSKEATQKHIISLEEESLKRAQLAEPQSLNLQIRANTLSFFRAVN